MTTSTGVAVMTVQELGVVAEAMYKGGLFGFKNKDQAFSLMILAQAQGQHPATIVQDYHIFSTGKASLRSDTVLARFQKQGGVIQWIATTDQVAKAKFSHPQSGDCEFSWTIEEAKRANLLGKDVWKGYPADMLRARCIYRGVRAMLPMVFGGMYGREEMEDAGLDREPQNIEHVVVETKVTPLGRIVMKTRDDLIAALALAKTKEDFAAIRGHVKTDFVDENLLTGGPEGETYLHLLTAAWKKLSAPKVSGADEAAAIDELRNKFIAACDECGDHETLAKLQTACDSDSALNDHSPCLDALAHASSRLGIADDGQDLPE